MENNLFYCKTEGSIFKNLFELLQKNIKNGSFNIHKDGITFKMTDSHGKTLIAFELYAENFSAFHYNNNVAMSIGLNLFHTYKDIKNIKIKDSLSFSISKNDRTRMKIETINKDKTRTTTSYIKIQEFQVLDIDTPEGYGQPINIPSRDYLKIIKDLIVMDAQQLEIASFPKLIKFSCKTNDIYERNIVVGDGIEENQIHVQNFEMKQFSRIQKIASLGNKIQVYQTSSLPLLLKSNIGDIGKISIFLKDITQYEINAHTYVESDNDE